MNELMHFVSGKAKLLKRRQKQCAVEICRYKESGVAGSNITLHKAPANETSTWDYYQHHYRYSVYKHVKIICLSTVRLRCDSFLCVFFF